MQWYTTMLFDFSIASDRAGRREYWLFMLVTVGLLCAVNALDALLGADGWLLSLGILALTLPVCKQVARRLRDLDIDHKWAFAPFVVLALWLIPAAILMAISQRVAVAEQATIQLVNPDPSPLALLLMDLIYVLDIATLIAFLTVAVFTPLLAGDRGENRFGPAPAPLVLT